MSEGFKYMLAGVAKDRHTVTALTIMVEEPGILRGVITESTTIPLLDKVIFQIYFDKKEEDPDRIQGFKNLLGRLIKDGDIESAKIYKRVEKEA